MHERSPITANTLKLVSEQLAGVPVASALAEEHVASMESLMQGVDALRRLPFKDLMPPLSFAPQEDLL